MQFTAPAASIHYDLFVNCAPSRDSNYLVMPFHLLMEQAHEEIRKTKPEIQDYRQISYTALADLNLAIKAALKVCTGYDAIVVDSRTPDGAAVLTTLEACASCIVRSF